MQKRILSMLLVLAMVLSFVPAVVTAAGTVQASPKAGTHDAAGHADDCGLTAGWTEWTASTSLPTEGQIVLMTDVALSGQIVLTGDLTVCLNGYVITAASNSRLFTVAADTELVITDCTAYADANGAYQAGALTGGLDKTKTGGGAVLVNGGAVLKLYDGKLTGNKAQHDSAIGGAVALKADAEFYMYGGELSDNKAVKANGKDVRQGGAVYLTAESSFTMTGGTIKNNTGSGGAIYARNASVSISNALITGNTGNNGGAIYSEGPLIIADSVITGNTGASTNTTYGYSAAVLAAGNNSKLTLSGKVIIADNTMYGSVPDVSFTKATTDTLYIHNLTDGSRVVFATPNITDVETVEAKEVIALNEDKKQTEPWQSSWVKWLSAIDGTGEVMDVGLVDNEFVWGHYHGTQAYTALDTADQLIAGGHYYLASDRKLDKEAVITTNVDVDLCLNGHTLTAPDGARVLSTNKNTVQSSIVIDDCTAYTDSQGVYHAGSITGANHTATGGVLYIRRDAQLDLYEGKITGNHGGSGGAVILTGTVRMHGGEISGNFAGTEGNWKSGGAVYLNANATFVMNGGTIKNNRAGSGGAFFMGLDATLELNGGTVTGNVAATDAGGIYCRDTSIIKMSGDPQVTGNSANGKTSNLWMYGASLIQLDQLDATAKVGITLAPKRIESGNMAFTAELAEGVDPSASFSSDDSAYKVELVSKKLTLTENAVTPPPAAEDHEHNGCNDSACTDHAAIEYKAWTDPNNLPDDGSWYLDTDVTVSQTIAYGAGANKTVNLCLNGHTITQASGTSARMYETTKTGSGVTITIADCTAKTENGVYTAGKITGFTMNNVAHGSVMYLRRGTTLELFDGIFTDNRTVGKSAGALMIDCTFNMYGGEFSNNVADDGNGNAGAIYLNQYSLATITGGTFKDNYAEQGGAIYMGRDNAHSITGVTFTGNTATDIGGALNIGTTTGAGVTVKDCTFENNTAAGKGGAIRVAGVARIEGCTVTGNTAPEGGGVHVSSKASLTLAGLNTIIGNTTGNLYLSEGQKLTLSQLDEDSRIGVTALPMSVLSQPCADYAASFTSDNTQYQVIYKDGALYLDAASDHKHCFCAGTSGQCDHTVNTYMKWDNPKKLPTSGNYYLTVDVVLSTRRGLNGTELNLCLNGHSITTKDKRAFYLNDDAVLRISDCTANPGKITGATAGAIMTDGDSTALVELYGGILTGNENTSLGGAILIQGSTTFNMYGGKITGNALHSKVKTDENGEPILDSKGNQQYTSDRGGGGVGLYGENTEFHLYGGEITNNQTTKAVYLKDGKQTNAGGFGGGIYSYKGNIYIHGGKITGNTTDRTGGGMFGIYGLIQIDGGEISGNKTGASGAGFYASTKSTVNITGGVITGNTAGSNAGGFYANTGSVVTMTGGKVSGNTSGSTAGGVFLSGKNTVMTMTGGEISGNTAGGSAGGILVQSTATFHLKGAKVTGNYCKGSGGGVYISKRSHFTMEGGSISNNTAKGGAGGLLLAAKADGKITGGSISYNSTQGYAGGIRVYGATLTASGLSIIGNTSVKSGAGLYTAGTTIEINGAEQPAYVTVNLYGCTVSGNKSDGSAGGLLFQSKGTVANISGCTVQNNKATASGGGMYVSSNVTLNMKDCKFVGNEAKASGAFRLHNCTATVDGAVIAKNAALDSSGGGFFVSGVDCKAELKNLEVYGNTGKSGGGGLIQSQATATVTDSRFYENTATSNAGGGLYIGGGAVVQLQDLEIYKNESVKLAGGLYAGAGTTVTADNLSIHHNHAGETGGGMAIGANLTLTNSVIDSNSSDGNGGGMATSASGSQYTGWRAGSHISDCQFINNTAGAQGGGIYIHRGGPLDLTDVTITGNEAGQEGSAILANGKMMLTDVTITENTSLAGKYALYLTPADSDGHTYYSGYKTIRGNIVIEDNEGGEVYLDAGIPLVLEGSLGDSSTLQVTLSDGVLTQRVLGVYHYEGEGLTYTLTAGDRSITEPMAPEGAEQAQDAAEADANVILYVGVGVFALAVIAVIVLLIAKKKKAGKTAEEAKQD